MSLVGHGSKHGSKHSEVECYTMMQLATQRWPSRSWEPFSLKSAFSGQCPLGSKLTAYQYRRPRNWGFICLCLPPDRTWHKVNDPKVDHSGDLEKGKVVQVPGSSPAGVCWSSVHLVQFGSDEPSSSWTQIWVQGRMPDYSLNWTARSSAIKGWQRCHWCSLPIRRWSSQSWRPFGLKSVFVGQYPLARAEARALLNYAGHRPIWA